MIIYYKNTKTFYINSINSLFFYTHKLFHCFWTRQLFLTTKYENKSFIYIFSPPPNIYIPLIILITIPCIFLHKFILRYTDEHFLLKTDTTIIPV